ncbi:hypothetical protein GCM10011369_05710 [Neiella marina]|uniref:PD(D/E)XK endonuclease domain-containing protein n=1 Tax=Neiella marina TaxID=508461 RepID=A0A8J2XMV3_9GAMM|nr:group I intron-associated PD-(D/E)XK endonuclease [Neiella marina]GGA66938.1 hypothetical protein GCM10011369_05710 [Neiella marina]
MPTKCTLPAPKAKQYYKSISYETLVASWLMNDGWEVFMPLTDHGMKTDVLISDGKTYYRIQVKSLDSPEENSVVECKWGNAKIDYVVYFSRCRSWGYIAPPFQGRRKLNHAQHVRFHQEQRNFIKAFNKS